MAAYISDGKRTQPVSDLVMDAGAAAVRGFLLGFNEAIQCVRQVEDLEWTNCWIKAAAQIFASHLEKEFHGLEQNIWKYFSIRESAQAYSIKIRRLLSREDGGYYKGDPRFGPRRARVCQTAPEVTKLKRRWPQEPLTRLDWENS